MRKRPLRRSSVVADLLNGEVGVGRDASVSASSVRTNVDDHHHRSRAETLEQLRDLEVGRAQARSRVVEAYRALLRCPVSCRNHHEAAEGSPPASHPWPSPSQLGTLTVDLPEHPPHLFHVVEVEKERLRVLVVLLERHGERVRDVDRVAVILTKKHAENSLLVGQRDTGGVVNDAEKN